MNREHAKSRLPFSLPLFLSNAERQVLVLHHADWYLCVAPVQQLALPEGACAEFTAQLSPTNCLHTGLTAGDRRIAGSCFCGAKKLDELVSQRWTWMVWDTFSFSLDFFGAMLDGSLALWDKLTSPPFAQ